MAQTNMQNSFNFSLVPLATNDNFLEEKNNLTPANKRRFDSIKLGDVIDITMDPQVLYLKGADYYHGHNVNQSYETAFTYFRISADQGNTNGQNSLSVIYTRGQGVDQNYEVAIEYARLSAAQGNASGQNTLGAIYQHGRGVDQNYEIAAKYYKLSAEQKNASSQTINLSKIR